MSTNSNEAEIIFHSYTLMIKEITIISQIHT